MVWGSKKKAKDTLNLIDKEFHKFTYKQKSMATIIKVPKNPTRKQIENLNRKIKELPRKNISKHFGKLKWPMDGLEYQKMMRNEWN